MLSAVIALEAAVDHHAFVNAVAALVAAGPSQGNIVSWGPLLIAAGGLITAVVTALARRDRKQSDVVTNIDARTNTALKGLEAYADRLEKERAAWQERAETAESRVQELETENDRLKDECDNCRLNPRRRPKARE